MQGFFLTSFTFFAYARKRSFFGGVISCQVLCLCWLVGGGTALMDLYLVLCVVWGLVVITGGSLSVLNDTVMSGSLYYKVFNLFNPFL